MPILISESSRSLIIPRIFNATICFVKTRAFVRRNLSRSNAGVSSVSNFLTLRYKSRPVFFKRYYPSPFRGRILLKDRISGIDIVVSRPYRSCSVLPSPHEVCISVSDIACDGCEPISRNTEDGSVDVLKKFPEIRVKISDLPPPPVSLDSPPTSFSYAALCAAVFPHLEPHEGCP